MGAKVTNKFEVKKTVRGWKKSGIWDAIKLGSKNLSSIDPFAEIAPMLSDEAIQIDTEPVAKDCQYDYTTETEDQDIKVEPSEIAEGAWFAPEEAYAQAVSYFDKTALKAYVERFGLSGPAYCRNLSVA